MKCGNGLKYDFIFVVVVVVVVVVEVVVVGVVGAADEILSNFQ